MCNTLANCLPFTRELTCQLSGIFIDRTKRSSNVQSACIGSKLLLLGFVTLRINTSLSFKESKKLV